MVLRNSVTYRQHLGYKHHDRKGAKGAKYAKAAKVTRGKPRKEYLRYSSDDSEMFEGTKVTSQSPKNAVDDSKAGCRVNKANFSVAIDLDDDEESDQDIEELLFE